MTWIEAICKVLEESPEPMHYSEIAKSVVNQNLVDHKGSAPASVAASILSTHINSEKERSLVTRVARGHYTLSDKTISDDEERDVIVACFGMFWERDPICWRTTPQIWGLQYTGSDPVDFCNQVGVYLLYDGREVIYVGRIVDRILGKRLFEHTRDRLRTRWNRFLVVRAASSGRRQWHARESAHFVLCLDDDPDARGGSHRGAGTSPES